MTALYEYRFTRHRVAEVTFPDEAMTGPARVAAVAGDMIGDDESESFLVFALSTRNRIIGVDRLYRGNVSAAMVRVGEVFRFAVRVNASRIIVAHNHPSGDPTPSPDDLHLTAELVAAGRLLDIPVLDHVIVDADGHVSLRDRGVAFDR